MSAGLQMLDFPTRTARLSQTCHGCGAVSKKPLSQRWHVCACGIAAQRGLNSAFLTACVEGDRLDAARALREVGRCGHAPPGGAGRYSPTGECRATAVQFRPESPEPEPIACGSQPEGSRGSRWCICYTFLKWQQWELERACRTAGTPTSLEWGGCQYGAATPLRAAVWHREKPLCVFCQDTSSTTQGLMLANPETAEFLLEKLRGHPAD